MTVQWFSKAIKCAIIAISWNQFGFFNHLSGGAELI